ncbi:MAG: prephenate dehydrogenase [Solirubrobacteraceae bacterium]|nr:prephenate dehydrogenase [Solirubrobacteraceae bacterium]
MTIAVIGVGLIGGSVGLAARERLGATVRGFDPGDGVLDAAIERGAVDEACASPAEAVAGAETVFVAVPVGAVPAVVGEALAAAGAECVVSDVGSTKRDVVAAHDDPRFVGGHPLTGAETAGVEHARADLFDGATWYLTPTAATSGILYERLHRAIAGLGAHPAAIDAATHDRLLANVSHLPHVLANVLVSQAAQALARDDRRRLLEAGLEGASVHELRLSVPNRPGIVAQVALALGKAGVNIADMALAPAPDMRSGSMTLWIAGAGDADRAQRLIEDLGFPTAVVEG